MLTVIFMGQVLPQLQVSTVYRNNAINKTEINDLLRIQTVSMSPPYYCNMTLLKRHFNKKNSGGATKISPLVSRNFL